MNKIKVEDLCRLATVSGEPVTKEDLQEMKEKLCEGTSEIHPMLTEEQLQEIKKPFPVPKPAPWKLNRKMKRNFKRKGTIF
jgi:hypothetical protein